MHHKRAACVGGKRTKDIVLAQRVRSSLTYCLVLSGLDGHHGIGRCKTGHIHSLLNHVRRSLNGDGLALEIGVSDGLSLGLAAIVELHGCATR